jgi:molybdopterin converting factor small subunit
MQRHRIRYYGLLAERTGCQGEELPLPDGSTVATLRRMLHERHAALEHLTYRVAVGGRLAADADAVPPEAALDLLPPFAGG